MSPASTPTRDSADWVYTKTLTRLLDLRPFEEAIYRAGTYAIAVYPQFPREFGGGKRALVFLLTTDNAPTHLTDLPVPIKGARIGPILLLFETPTMYMVKAAEGSAELFGPKSREPAVGIDKRFISALITAPRGDMEKSGSPSSPDTVDPRGPKGK